MVWGLTVFPFQEGERCSGNGILPELVLLCRSRHIRRRLAGNELLQEWEALPAEGRWFFPRPVPAVPVCGKRARTEDGGCRELSMEGFRCGECRAYNDDGTSRTQQGLPHEAVRQPLKKKMENCVAYALRRRIISAARPSRPRVAVAGSGTAAISLISWRICSWERAES